MVLTAASTDRILGSWGVTLADPMDVSADSGPNVGARGEWLYDNDPLAKAVVETILAGALGTSGLEYHSLYQADDAEKASDAEVAVRKQIARRLRCATRGTRFDANGVLSRREMSAVTLASAITRGDSWSVRCWLPNRPGRQTHATCWRIIHSARVCNPQWRADSEHFRQGIELDDSGDPIAIHVLSAHPASRVTKSREWVRVALYAPDGSPNVTHHCVHRIPGQLRPVGWFAPVIQLMRLFGRTLEAKTVADSLKASMGLICECEDPEGMADADANGAVLTGNTKIVPGKVYYVRKGTVWKELNFQYNGQDFASWFDVVMTNLCAPFRVPPEFVLQRLTRSNMASSRVALAQAYATFHSTQNDLIGSTEDPWNHSVIHEDLARGTLGIAAPAEVEALDRLLSGHYMRPPRWMPDPMREGQAAALWVHQLGKSPTSVYADQGESFADQVVQRAQDDALMEQHGVELAPANAKGKPTSPSGDDNAAVDDDAPRGRPKDDDGAVAGEPVAQGDA
ncbi:MAG: phage portal protein [Planctomycetes bacterium]|nr:phage portal protein [Planctomycetota bacterium]